MSFSTSFCLTNIGNLPPNTTLSFYSNADGYTVPFQTTVPLFSVTGNNCPYTLTGVPNGTQQIKVESSTGHCCAVVDITPNDPCSFCNLGFDSFSAATIGEIVAGNLTGSCNNNITDYLIEWYDVTNPSSPVLKFTSGHGLIFTYQYTHPLVNTTSIPALPGLYKPFLRKVVINNITYSYDGGTGTVQANLDCFSTVSVNVTPLNCSNGTEVGDYSHLIQFSGASQGVQPAPLTTIFQLSADTNYIAWRFWGYDIADELKITYYGSHYNNNPIILEWLSIGNNNQFSDLRLTSFPKVIHTYNDNNDGDNYGKITCLTGLTRSDNDYLLIEVKPSVLNTKTNFKLKLQCLTTFNCTSCFDNYLNSPEKIIESSLVLTPNSCNQLNITYSYSGCSTSDLSSSDLYKYTRVTGGNNPTSFDNYVGNGGNIFTQTFVWDKTQCTQRGGGYNTICEIPKNSVITFNKDNSGSGGKGNIYMTFSDISDFNAYYNSYNDRLSSIGGVPTDPTNIDYYKGVYLTTPVPNGLTDQCGDTTVKTSYLIHATSVVTTGFTNNTYTLNFTMPTITNQMTFTQCQLYCQTYIDGIVLSVNGPSTGNTNNLSYTNNRGNRYTIPCNNIVSMAIVSNPVTATTLYDFVKYSKFSNETIPFSANTSGGYTNIDSLSAITCNFNYLPFVDGLPNTNEGYYVQILAYYPLTLTNPLNVNDFIIQTSPISNGNFVNQQPQPVPYSGIYPEPSSLITIYQNVNGVGTILEPSYFI